MIALKVITYSYIWQNGYMKVFSEKRHVTFALQPILPQSCIIFVQ